LYVLNRLEAFHLMTPADEITFIQLWQQGASYAVIARALRIPCGTVGSRAKRLAAQGKIQPRLRGGAYPKQHTLTRAEAEGPPSTVDPHTWKLQQLKHSVRWTIYMPQSLKEEIQRRAQTRGQPPSVFLQELVWQALHDQPPSTP
jgi:hypothetical protein